MNYTVIGFSDDAKHVIFKIEDDFKFLKSTLPKADLIAYLDIDPFMINSDFRNEILAKAKEGGRCNKAFSIDGENWTKSINTQRPKNGSPIYLDKYNKFFNIKDWELLPKGKKLDSNGEEFN